VFVKGQNPATDTAPHRGTRTVVKLAHAIGLVRWAGQNAVIIASEQSWGDVKRQARAGAREVPRRHYIPDTLPPMETGGCVFQEPDNLVWQLRHAAASRSLKSKARLMRLALGYDKPKEVYA
jgi:hypothetical protein